LRDEVSARSATDVGAIESATFEKKEKRGLKDATTDSQKVASVPAFMGSLRSSIPTTLVTSTSWLVRKERTLTV